MTIYYAVTGRVPGDDEDTTLFFESDEEEGLSISELCDRFEDGMYDDSLDDRGSVKEHYGQAVYINCVLRSISPIEVIA